MESESKINGNISESRKFQAGVAKILKLTYQTSEIEAKANKIICNLLNNLLNKSIKELKKINAEKANVENVQKVIEKILPSSLAELAISEGQKELFLWQTMPFDFVPKRKLSKEEKESKIIEISKKREQKILNGTFVEGVEGVLKNTQPGCKIDKTAKKEASLFLHKLLDEMIRKLKQTSQHPKPEDVQKVTREILPDTLAEHATSEGQKMIFKYKNRGFYFKPEKRVTEESEKEKTVKEKSAIQGKESKQSEDISASESSTPLKKRDSNGKEYKQGLATISKKIHPHATFESKAQRTIGNELEDLKDLIMKKIRESEGTKTHEDVQTAMRIYLPPLMAEHAHAEGQKMITRYDNGDFRSIFGTDDEETSNYQRKRYREAEEVQTLDLESGLVAISKITQPKVVLHKSGIKHISSDLNDLFEALLKKVKESNPEKVKSTDIQKAAKEIMPGVLAEHASAEGEKMVSLHEMKVITFQPKRKRRHSGKVNEGEKKKK